MSSPTDPSHRDTTNLGDGDSERSLDSSTHSGESMKDFIDDDDEVDNVGSSSGSGGEIDTNLSSNIQEGNAQVHPFPRDSSVGSVQDLTFFNTREEGDMGLPQRESLMDTTRDRVVRGAPSQDSYNAGNPFSSLGRVTASHATGRSAFGLRDMDASNATQEGRSHFSSHLSGGTDFNHDDEESLAPSLGGPPLERNFNREGQDTRKEELSREPHQNLQKTTLYGSDSLRRSEEGMRGNDGARTKLPTLTEPSAPSTQEPSVSGGGIAIDYNEFPGEELATGHHESRGGTSPATESGRAISVIREAARTLEAIEHSREDRLAEDNATALPIRLALLQELGQCGTLASVLSLDSDSRENLGIDLVEVLGRGVQYLQGSCELYQLSLRSTQSDEVFDLPTIQALLDESVALLQECRGDMIKVGASLRSQGKSRLTGEEFFNATYRRLDLLAGTLSKRYHKVSLRTVFPTASNEAIVDWYLQLNCLLFETLRTKESYRSAIKELTNLCLQDPGPVLEPPPPLKNSGTTQISSLKSSPLDKSQEGPMKSAGILGWGYRSGGGNLAQSMLLEADKAAQRGDAPRPSLAFAMGKKDSDKLPQEVTARKKIPRPLSTHVEEVRDDVSTVSMGSKANQGSLHRSNENTWDENDSALLEEMKTYLQGELKRRGKLNQITLKMAMASIPVNVRFDIGKGNEAKFMKTFSEIAASLTPEIEGANVNVQHWLELIKELSTSYGLPLRFLFQFMKLHGGLKTGHAQTAQDRVKRKFNRPVTWLEDFDPSHTSYDDTYWIYQWMGAVLELIFMFWKAPSEATNKAGLRKILLKLKLTHKEDPANQEFYLVANTYETMVQYLFDRGALLPTSYGRLMTMLREHLETLAPGGAFIEQLLGEGILKMTTDPGRYLERGHGLDEEELNDLCMRGEQGLLAEDYELLLSTISTRASNGALEYRANSLSQLSSLISAEGTFSVVPPSKGAAKKAAAALQVTSDGEALSLAVRSSKPPCGDCNLFHEEKLCPYFDTKKKKLNYQAMLGTDGVLIQMKDKSWLVGTWFKRKLKSFAFDHMGIKDENQQATFIAEMDKIASDLGKRDQLPANLGGHIGKHSPGYKPYSSGASASGSAVKTAPKKADEPWKAKVGMLEKKLCATKKELKAFKDSEDSPKATLYVNNAGESVTRDQDEDCYVYDQETQSWIDQEE